MDCYFSTESENTSGLETEVSTLTSTENGLHRCLLGIWKQVPIPAPHFFGLVADPGVDNSLVDALHRAIADEGVTKTVPTRNPVPLAAAKCSFDAVACVVACKWCRISIHRPAERDLTAGVFAHPVTDCRSKRL